MERMVCIDIPWILWQDPTYEQTKHECNSPERRDIPFAYHGHLLSRGCFSEARGENVQEGWTDAPPVGSPDRGGIRQEDGPANREAFGRGSSNGPTKCRSIG